jgi:zinc protease
MRLSRLVISLLLAAPSVNFIAIASPPVAHSPVADQLSPILSQKSIKPSLPKYGAIVKQTKDKTTNVTETKLANGLTILTKESHSAPVAYFGVYYNVGSRNEVTGQTGLSHILEHMMFKGTKTLPPGSIARLFQANGASINAQTSMDYTCYHELISSDRLELAVRIEADRMINSLFDPVELGHEMSVVRSELEGDSNDPGRQLNDFTFVPLSFISHSYHWPTLGWREDVENAANHREVIYKYYKDHYMPNNATVVVVGDFDTPKLVALCQKYFGVYPAGKLEHHYITPESTQMGERRAVLRRPGASGIVEIGWKAPALGNPDHYAMDVMSLILSSGQTSRFYQNLVKTSIVQEGASAGCYDTKDPYVFVVSASPQETSNNAKVEAGLEAEIEKLKSDLVTPEELERAKNQIIANYTFQNDSVSEQAEQLGFYQTIYGDYHYASTYLDKIKAITPEQIRDVAQRYFVTDKRTVAIFEPQPIPAGTKSNAPLPHAEHFGVVTSKPTSTQEKTVSALEAQYSSAQKTTPKAYALPIRKVLPNGLTIFVQENHSNKTIAVAGSFKAGGIFDPSDKRGVASFTAAMLKEGAAGKSDNDIARSLEDVNASASVSASTENAGFGGYSLSKDFGLVIGTLADELRHPDFPPAQLEQLRMQTLTELEQEKQDAGGTGGAGRLADIAFSQAIFPVGHPYRSPSLDDQETSVKSITIADLQAFHDKYYRPDTAVIVVVGDIKASDAIDTITKAFGDWQKPSDPAPIVDIPDVPMPISTPDPINVTLPGTMQTSILFGHAEQLKRNDPDFYAATVMNYILGGSIFGSRLGDQIRDKGGLAYTVYSYIDSGLGAGPFETFVGTNPANANKVLSMIKSVITDFKEKGVTKAEVQGAVDYLTGSYPLSLETNSGVARVILSENVYGLGLDYVNNRAGYYRKVTVGQVNALAKKMLQPDSATVVIAGAPPVK